MRVWNEVGYGDDGAGLGLAEGSELDGPGCIWNLYCSGWVLELQLDHVFNQQLVLVGLPILIENVLDRFGETFSDSSGSTPGGRSAPNYGNLYLDGRIIPSPLKRFWPQNSIICNERGQIRYIEHG